jgi:hypothetical protein
MRDYSPDVVDGALSDGIPDNGAVALLSVVVLDERRAEARNLRIKDVLLF